MVKMQHIRPEVASVAELGLTLVEELLDVLIPAVRRTASDTAAHRLTVCGTILAMQHARGSVSEFTLGRPYSGAALDRCMYEAMVRVMQWNLNPKLALREWRALPVWGEQEEQRRAGDPSRVPKGVQNDIKAYLAKNRDLENIKLTKFGATARHIWRNVNRLTDDQIRSDLYCHVDTPSLFVHCRPLIAEDIFDTSNPSGWQIRTDSTMVESNARVLEIVRMLLLFAGFLAKRYGIAVRPVERVSRRWQRAVTKHEAIISKHRH